jgi:hypothetical protein
MRFLVQIASRTSCVIKSKAADNTQEKHDGVAEICEVDTVFLARKSTSAEETRLTLGKLGSEIPTIPIAFPNCLAVLAKSMCKQLKIVLLRESHFGTVLAVL